MTGVAPGRVNLIGEHVDYNGGRCLPIALIQSTRATVTARDDDHVRVTSGSRVWEGSHGRLDQAEPWAAYVTGVVPALEVHSGVDVEISSDVPIGAGLSSSAALECSVAVALDEVFSLGRSHEEIVRACVRAEQDYVGAPTGGLDQAIAVYGESSKALLIDFATGAREQVPFDPSGHGLALLVIDTKVSHELTDGGYGSRRDEAWDAAKRLEVDHLRVGIGVRSTTACPSRWTVVRDMSSPRWPASTPSSRRCARTTGTCSARSWTPRTPRCATTTRSRARSSTSLSRWPARPARSVPG